MTHKLHVERYSRFFQDLVAPAVMRRDGNKCVKCGSVKNLEISHNRYGEDITMKDLETLCRSCHKKKDHALGLFVKTYPDSHKED